MKAVSQFSFGLAGGNSIRNVSRLYCGSANSDSQLEPGEISHLQ